MPSKSAQQRWYQEHKEEMTEYHRIRRRMFRGIIRELKFNPCHDCNLMYPWYVMDFDHLPGSDKKFDLGRVENISSVRVLLAEIDKCELVCSNCHRIRTYLRLQDG